MANPTVLIIGCGVAGPVLAVLLKRKGYNPIVFEKVRVLGEAGASLMLMPNGMKVLNLVGLADKVKSISTPMLEMCEATLNGNILAESTLPSSFPTTYSQPVIGIKRTTLNLLLKDMLLSMNIDVREGWGLTGIEETEDSVTAVFGGGRKVTGSFLIGCDGIKAASRRILLQSQNQEEGIPQFTGLTQTAGISTTPISMLANPALRNWYGVGAHVIAYPVSPSQTSWAITLPGSKDSEETWRLYDATERDALKEKIVAMLEDWAPEVRQMVSSAERIISYGLFDRPELRPEQWHSRRCVLVGDAAHPTSPHLGQGANQAFEDCYHLSQLLPDLNPSPLHSKPGLSRLQHSLSDIFQRFAEMRQPRTSQLVKGARTQGQKRVVLSGEAACRDRDAAIAAAWRDTAAVAAKYDDLCREPFVA